MNPTANGIGLHCRDHAAMTLVRIYRASPSPLIPDSVLISRKLSTAAWRCGGKEGLGLRVGGVWSRAEQGRPRPVSASMKAQRRPRGAPPRPARTKRREGTGARRCRGGGLRPRSLNRKGAGRAEMQIPISRCGGVTQVASPADICFVCFSLFHNFINIIAGCKKNCDQLNTCAQRSGRRWLLPFRAQTGVGVGSTPSLLSSTLAAYGAARPKRSGLGHLKRHCRPRSLPGLGQASRRAEGDLGASTASSLRGHCKT